MIDYPEPFRNSAQGVGPSSYMRNGMRISGADRLPCPACGNSTGDCTGETSPPKHIAGFNQIESLKATQTVLVEEDIYEMRQITKFATIRVVIHRKGDYIPIPRAKELGLIT